MAFVQRAKSPPEMAPRFLTILTGRNLPNIRQAREPAPSTINEKTIADFHARGRANGNSPRPDDARFRTARSGHAAREGFATAGWWVGAVALTHPVTKYLSNGAKCALESTPAAIGPALCSQQAGVVWCGIDPPNAQRRLSDD
jgi:hypothetical protein